MTVIDTARPTPDPGAHPRLPGTVHALLLMAPDTPDAAREALVRALDAQTRRPDAVAVRSLPALTGPAIRAAAASFAAEVTTPDQTTADDALLWVLPVGAVPEADALAELLAVWQRSPSTAIVGPKHLDPGDPGRLQALDLRATRLGRVLPDPAPGDPDQGQFDHRTDVLAVPLVGALVEARLLTGLRAPVAALGDLGADLDLGWRAQLGARRVVVAPRARLGTDAALVPTVADTGARRRGARRVAFARAAWWSAPLLALWVALRQLVAGLLLLLLKRPRAAAAELSHLPAADPVTGLLTRWRTRTRRAVRRSDIASLFAPLALVRRDAADAVHDALIGPRAPSGSRDPLAGARPEGGQVRRPLTLALLATVVTLLVGARTLGWSAARGLWTGWTGGELTGGSSDAATLYHQWFDAWGGAGLGGPVPDQPALALLSVPARLAGLLGSPAPAGASTAWLLALTLPAAAVTTHLAARVLTRSRGVRAVGAVLWATSGLALTTVGEGRLGAAVALVLLPAVAAGLALCARRDGSATAAFATALAASVLGAFAPPLLVLVLTAALVVLSRGPGGVRWRAAIVLVVPLLALGPWLRDAVHDPRLLLTGPGLQTWGWAPVDSRRVALLDLTPGASSWWAGLPLVLLGVAALAGIRHAPRLAWGAAGVAVLGVGLALAADRVVLAQAAGEVRPWPGTLLLVTALALVVAVVLALREWRPSSGDRWSGAPRWAAVLLALTGCALGAWTGLGDQLQTWRDPRPAVALEHADGPTGSRALLLTPGAAATTFAVLSADDGAPVRMLPTATDAPLAPAVTALLDDRGDQPATEVARWAVSLVGLAASPADEPIARRLDATEGLSRMAGRDGWWFWRVLPSAAGIPDAVAPPRLLLTAGSTAEAVPMTGPHGATSTEIHPAEAARLVVAAPADWAAEATVRADGVTLRAVPGADRPTYRVPAGTESLTISLAGADRAWHLAQLLGVAVLVFLAIPFGRRASRGGAR